MSALNRIYAVLSTEEVKNVKAYYFQVLVNKTKKALKEGYSYEEAFSFAASIAAIDFTANAYHVNHNDLYDLLLPSEEYINQLFDVVDRNI